MTVFLSYARLDHAVVDPMVARLDQKNVAYWFDRRDIPVSFLWQIEIGHAIRSADLLVVLESEAVLIRTPRPLSAEKAEQAERMMSRIEGVLATQESKYIMLNAPESALDRISALLPGAEAPTILPLAGRPGHVAVHAVCKESVFWETLQKLKAAGASAILVMPIEKMML